jgi:hypothetical protein
MKKHTYIRAYLAGIAMPTVVMLLALILFVGGRLAFKIPDGFERLLIFPLALVPNAWGAWNILYVRLGPGRRLPQGFHGATLLFLLAPLGLLLARMVHGWMERPTTSLIITAFPIALVIYYLAWKHVVGYLNRMLEINNE